MQRGVSFFVVILAVLITVIGVSAQNISFQPSPHVYKIKISGCTYPPESRTQTGFRVKNLPGIVTALHGVLSCKSIVAEPSGDDTIYSNLIIAKVDVNRDTALLWSEQIAATPTAGLEIVASPKDSDYAGAYVIGYPYGLFRQKVTADVKITDVTALGNLLPEKDIGSVGERSSPALSVQVFSVQAPLVPGHSGAPLLTRNGRVLGIGNGGLDLGRVDMAWAIPWHTIQWKTVSAKVSQNVSWEDAQRIKDLEKQDPKLVFAFPDEEPVTPVGEEPTLKSSTSASPQTIFEQAVGDITFKLDAIENLGTEVIVWVIAYNRGGDIDTALCNLVNGQNRHCVLTDEKGNSSLIRGLMIQNQRRNVTWQFVTIPGNSPYRFGIIFQASNVKMASLVEVVITGKSVKWNNVPVPYQAPTGTSVPTSPDTSTSEPIPTVSEQTVGDITFKLDSIENQGTEVIVWVIADNHGGDIDTALCNLGDGQGHYCVLTDEKGNSGLIRGLMIQNQRRYVTWQFVTIPGNSPYRFGIIFQASSVKMASLVEVVTTGKSVKWYDVPVPYPTPK